MPATIRSPTTAEGLSTRILEKGPAYLRKQLELEGLVRGQRSAVEMLAASKSRYLKCDQVVKDNSVDRKDAESGGTNGSCKGIPKGCAKNSDACNHLENGQTDGERDQSFSQTAVLRRNSSKRQRPDSLLIYRQKCELVKGPVNGNVTGSLIEKLFLNSMKDKIGSQAETPMDGFDEGEKHTRRAVRHHSTQQHEPSTITGEVHNPAEESDPHRNEAHISARYPRNTPEFETFFRFCGLDMDVVESLGQENFSARSDQRSLRSASRSTLNDQLARGDGLAEEDLKKCGRRELSVVERNARIIKWLYSCNKAMQSEKVLQNLNRKTQYNM